MTAAPTVLSVLAATLTAAAQPLFSDSRLLSVLGGAAGALAIAGLLLLLPLYLTHRREVARLLAWQESEPEAGTTEFRAVPPQWQTAGQRPGGMTAAERVTSERPALARITTAEHAALELEQASLWRRVIERGPRHPLVLSLLALLLAGAVFVAAALLIRSGNDDPQKGGNLDPASVQVAVVNAASTPGAAAKKADLLTGDGFAVAGITVASDRLKLTAVFYADGAKPAGRAVARSLGLAAPMPFDAKAEAAANGADVVVIAGDDAQADGGKR
ncbi:MAG: LytR C-terminal domain-containing protein [Solirubrobacterales bacterium]